VSASTLERMGKGDQIEACVLGDLDLVRPLIRDQIRCAVVARPGTPLSFSRLPSAFIDWADHWTERATLVERLVRFGLAQRDRPVLFYQTTGDMLTVSRNRERLSEAFQFIIANAALVEDLTDKARFHAMAERLGLPVPDTRFIDPMADEAGWKRESTFPLLLKPVTRQFNRWGKIAPDSKAVTVESRSQLEALWPHLMAAGTELVAQELIPGPESRIESYHTYIDPAGEVVADFTGRKIRTRPAEYGYSTSVVITDSADVREAGQDVAGRLGLVGVAKLDFKRAPDGRLLLLEVNPRFTLWHHPAAVAGLNIPAIVYRDLTEEPRRRLKCPTPGVTWCDPWEDAAAARDAGELGAGWLVDALRCKAKSALSWDDPMPFVRGVALPRLRARTARRIAGLPGPRVAASRLLHRREAV
jgi:D-aspartate ligase